MGSTFTGTAVTSPDTSASATSQEAQVFCTFEEICNDLNLPGGDVAAIMRHIRAAGKTIVQEIGMFIPFTAAKRFDGNGLDFMWVPPLLAVTSIVDDDDTYASTDYLLYPRQKHWQNGPYTQIGHDPDGDYATWTVERDIVVITGRWGKWEKEETTSAAVGTGGQSDSAATLLVTNGSKVSPGMVLLINSEQELVTGYSTPSTAVTTIAEDLDTSEEEITVADGTKVYDGETIRVNYEQMKVLEIQSNTLHVRRGWNNTAKATHTSGANVDAYRTFTVERGVNGTSAAAHTAATTIYRYLVPDDINYLAREIATLMLKKSQGAYAGKTGNAELGEVYYHDAFPRFDLDRLRLHYEVWD